MYICKECGYKSVSWIGRCPNCGAWNSFIEEKEENKSTKLKKSTSLPKLSKLEEIKNNSFSRVKTNISQLNLILGGGIVKGETILLSGEPGIGKSTLILQAIENINSIYIAGEESLSQIKHRSERLGLTLKKTFFSENSDVYSIINLITKMRDKVDLVIIDSLQTLKFNSESLSLNTSKVKEIIYELAKTGKKNKISLLIVGHITKGGEIAGPKLLEHIVDTVLLFEGEKNSNLRSLRAKKNRFGSIDNVALFKMEKEGLKEIRSSLLFPKTERLEVGEAITGIIEGRKPLFVKIQALIIPTYLSIPRRVVKGLDYNKVQILLAVIRKKLRMPLEKFDLYLNLVGGLKIKNPMIDLGIVASIISSYKNKAYPPSTIFSGEVDLLGNVLKHHGEKTISKEAKHLKFNKIVTSSTLKNISQLTSLI